MMGYRSFLSGFAIMLASAVAFAGVVIWASAGRIDPVASQGVGWTATIVRDRQQALAQRTEPVIAVVAGSNSLFGIKASIIEQRTGIKTVNASSHAALSWNFIEFAILSRVRRGDIVLMPIELEYFFSPTEPPMNNLTVTAAHSLGLDYFLSLSLKRKIEYISLLPASFVWRQISMPAGQESIMPIVGYWAFPGEPNGDIDTSKGVPNSEKVEAQAREKKIPASLPIPHRICETIKRLSNKGVKVIGTTPNIYLPAPMLEGYRALLPKLKQFYETCGAIWLLDNSGGAQVIGAMLDTPYHMTDYGRRARTTRLAEKLCTLIKCKR